MSDPRAFLSNAGWGDAEIAPLPGDASTRRYARLRHGARVGMLMDQPQAVESVGCAPDADEVTRRALGYNAVARLAGADCRRFAAVSNYLSQRGLSAPKILAADYAQGLLVIEDLGDDLFTEVVNGANGEALYNAAVEILAKLHTEQAPKFLSPPPASASQALLPSHAAATRPPPPALTRAGEADQDQDALPLFVYDEIALIAETDLMLEWFFPLALGRPATEGEYKEHRALWKAALDAIQGSDIVFVHRDYHAQNLLWLPEREGLGRVGLIDFQDAVAGSRAYDLVSLVEDARRDVPAALAENATRHYLEVAEEFGAPVDEEHFRAEMALMAAQRNTKIVGIFARLASRDGKRRYLGYLPRVWSYLEQDLNHPLLADLRHWYDRVLPKSKRAIAARATA
ncbi:MAG TPA: phosphotransferase [Rhizomicrobium sp.]|nr:phosphotransferase [Rhizomicrobium sp.]